jgi:hypothetical protein
MRKGRFSEEHGQGAGCRLAEIEAGQGSIEGRGDGQKLRKRWGFTPFLASAAGWRVTRVTRAPL